MTISCWRITVIFSRISTLRFLLNDQNDQKSRWNLFEIFDFSILSNSLLREIFGECVKALEIYRDWSCKISNLSKMSIFLEVLSVATSLRFMLNYFWKVFINCESKHVFKFVSNRSYFVIEQKLLSSIEQLTRSPFLASIWKHLPCLRLWKVSWKFVME